MLTHVNEKNQPTMVDVSEKNVTLRYAKARSIVKVPRELLSHLRDGDILTKKGPVFHTAIIAGTMAVKKTSDLIPFCHPLPLQSCHIDIQVSDDETILIECDAKAYYRTGIEMEVLTGASVAALTIYDMCKAISQEMVIERTYLVEKRGGKSDYNRES